MTLTKFPLNCLYVLNLFHEKSKNARVTNNEISMKKKEKTISWN